MSLEASRGSPVSGVGSVTEMEIFALQAFLSRNSYRTSASLD